MAIPGIPLSESSPTIVSTGAWDGSAGRSHFSIAVAGTLPTTQYDVSDRFYLMNGEATPLVKIMQALEGANTSSGWNDYHLWKEDVMLPQIDETDGSLEVDATEIPVSNPLKFVEHDEVVLFDYDAQGTVSTVGAASITVVWSTAPTVGIAPGAAVMRIGNSQMQGDIHVNQPTTVPYDRTNYYQDMRHGVSATDQHIAGKFIVHPDDWPREIQKQWNEHQLCIEKTLLVGQNAFITTGNTPRALTRGLWYSLATNETDFAGVAMTRATWTAAMQAMVIQNSMPNQRWVWWSGTRVLQDIMDFAQSYERTTTTAKEFGLDFDVFKLGGGHKIYLKRHPLFDTHAPFEDKAILVNMTEDNCGLRWHNVCAGTKKFKSIMPYGRTVQEEGWRSVFTMFFKGEQINGTRFINIG